MTAAGVLVVLVGVGLAYANGANDVSKGIATLVGSGVTDYRRAIAWGSAWTAVGGILGALFAGAMLTTFGGGLLTPGATSTFAAALATLSGAAGWVFFATRAGLPVSTTHAIVGSLVGVAALAYGVDAVRWSALGGKVFLPLLLTPFASLAVTGALLRAARGRAAGGGAAADCLCAGLEPASVARGVATGSSVALVPGSATLRLVAASAEACATSHPDALRLTLGHLHWLTSGATSLARGMNDAPKIVALALSASALGATAAVQPAVLYAVVTFGMVAGSLVGGRRVTRVLACDVTPMDNREGFAANLVTAALVTAGAVHGLPMSTTHVASGGIIGAGAQRGTLDLRSLRTIALAWVVTLPAAGILGAASYFLATVVTRW
ncbi:MAG: inorganic phosphate transporter [Myxococcota bacterium]